MSYEEGNLLPEGSHGCWARIMTHLLTVILECSKISFLNQSNSHSVQGKKKCSSNLFYCIYQFWRHPNRGCWSSDPINKFSWLAAFRMIAPLVSKLLKLISLAGWKIITLLVHTAMSPMVMVVLVTASPYTAVWNWSNTFLPGNSFVFSCNFS